VIRNVDLYGSVKKGLQGLEFFKQSMQNVRKLSRQLAGNC